MRSVLRITGETHWPSTSTGVHITDNVISSPPFVAPLSPSFPDPLRWVLFDNAGSVVADNPSVAIEIVLCPNVLLGSDQNRTVVRKEALLRNLSAFDMLTWVPRFACFTPTTSRTLTALGTPSISLATPSSLK